MTAFTPGPWTQHGSMVFAGGEHGANICALSEPRATTTVEYTPLRIGSPDADEAYANGRLIAAAPDLLTALHALRLAAGDGQISDHPPEAGCPLCEALRLTRAAITKARGEVQP